MPAQVNACISLKTSLAITVLHNRLTFGLSGIYCLINSNWPTIPFDYMLGIEIPHESHDHTINNDNMGTITIAITERI